MKQPVLASACFRLLFVIGLFSVNYSFAQKNVLRRADSFFGLHFDFHASANDELVGKTLTEGMIDSLLTAVKPDFIQIDSKGHPGVTSFPTKNSNGTHVKSFQKDPLELFRKVTRKHNVALYSHYSGVWDDAILQKKPNWGAVNEKGEFNTQKTSVHGPYIDSLLIPQLKELADYGLDGVWVDGDCWATVLDYSEKSLKAFKAETGLTSVPKSKQDANYLEFKNFARQSFLKYVGHYADELHKYKPSFQVASNWAYSSFMPYPVTLNIDFMSGDLSPSDGLNAALFESRVLATQSQYYKKPWDLMSWGFNYNWTGSVMNLKSSLNLCQEAAEVIAMGGGYQCYFTQNRDASIRPYQVKTMADIAKFVRARQPFCQKTTPIPQIAMLYSLTNFQKTSESLFGNGGTTALQGILSALMDGQHPTEILAEHHLHNNMSKYPLIVVPETQFLDNVFKQELLDYAKNGGNLLVIGLAATKHFQKELGVAFLDKPQKKIAWFGVNDKLAVVYDSIPNIKLESGKALSKLYNIQDLRFPEGISASVNDFGKGKIAGIYTNYGQSYRNYKSPELRDFLSNIVNQLFASPKVSITGSHLVHVTANTLGNKELINLINAGGEHANPKIFTYDELAPLQNLEVVINTDKKPKSVKLQPENQTLNFTYNKGLVKVKVPKVEIHSIVELEY